MEKLTRSVCGALVAVTAVGATHARAEDRGARPNQYGRLAPAFVRNVGQTDPAARFVSVGGGIPVFFTDRDVRFILSDKGRRFPVVLELVGGSQPAAIETADATGGVVNYLRGGIRGSGALPAYRTVIYRDIWPGIDAAFRGTPSSRPTFR